MHPEGVHLKAGRPKVDRAVEKKKNIGYRWGGGEAERCAGARKGCQVQFRPKTMRTRPISAVRPKLSSDISTQHCGPKQDILIKLYQKELRQLLGYGIYMIMLMILTFNKDPQV